MAGELFVSVEEMARRLGVGRAYAFQLVTRGEVPSVKLGKLRRISVAELERWAAEHASGAVAGVRA